MKTKIREEAHRVYEYINAEVFPTVFTFGNGGSCSIANHMEVDWTKNSDGAWSVTSLCSNSAMLSMMANDYEYEQTCAKQVLWKGTPDSTLVLISSSGKSQNIIKGARAARALGMAVIGFTGFEGGGLRDLCHVSVHLDSQDYGEIEDYHSQVMHEVARMLKESK